MVQKEFVQKLPDNENRLNKNQIWVRRLRLFIFDVVISINHSFIHTIHSSFESLFWFVLTKNKFKLEKSRKNLKKELKKKKLKKWT